MREISRMTKITHPSMINHLNCLIKEGLIIKEKKGIYPTYKANRDDELFKLYKRLDIMLRIKQTGLADYIYDSCHPDVVILFGSGSKGEDIEDSDIDIFVECAREKALNVRKYEVALGHRIELFTKQKITLLPKRLLNNVVNGVKLKGYFTIK